MSKSGIRSPLLLRPFVLSPALFPKSLFGNSAGKDHRVEGKSPRQTGVETQHGKTLSPQGQSRPTPSIIKNNRDPCVRLFPGRTCCNRVVGRRSTDAAAADQKNAGTAVPSIGASRKVNIVWGNRTIALTNCKRYGNIPLRDVLTRFCTVRGKSRHKGRNVPERFAWTSSVLT